MMQDNKPIVLQINVTANWGSTGKIVESIGIAALKSGWKSIIAFGRWSNLSRSHLIKIGGRLNKYFHYAEQRFFDNEGLASRIATKKLIRQIKEIKPDIVHLHNIHDHYLNYRLLFGYLNHTSIKVVWTFHDCWAFTGHCFHFVTKNCFKWKTGCFQCPMKNVLPKSFLDRSARNYKIKKASFEGCNNLTIVPCSDWMSRFVKDSFFKNKRVEVIKNGVDTSLFKPLNGEKSFGVFNVLAVSNVWNQEKGLYDIYILRSLLTSNYIITIVGLTENQIKSLPDGIVGKRRTQEIQELVKLYSNADVLINPTYADTFPTVNLEALACGTPVITYRTGGSPEAISPDTGAVIEQGDINSMAEAIMNICNKDRNRYRISCRKRAVESFSKERCNEHYIRLYEDLI